METVMMIPGELEHMESLVKVARKKKDVEAANTQVSMVSAVPTLTRLCINKTHRSKTFHLSVKVNNYLIEGLVDTGASMSVMAASVVRELGLMHLVSGSETYKTTSSAVTQALGRIKEVLIKVGGVQCSMTFMIVDTDSYDILLGLDMLIKIGAIVDVEQGLIQVRRGPGTDVEVLPLTVVNLVQRSDSRTDGRDGGDTQKQTPGNPEAGYGSPLSCKYGTNEWGRVQETDSNSDSSKSSDEGTKVVSPDGGASEFGDTEFEDLVMKEGLQQILQLTMKNRAGDVLKEELTDADDYADWIQWAADEEQRMQSLSKAASAGEKFVLLQI
jgi:predicted aspartyl protease